MKLEEYKKKRNKKVVLPSKLEIEVRSFSPYMFLKMRDANAKNSKDDEFYTAKLIESLFEKYLVNPKIPSQIKIDEFTKEDYEVIHQMIFKEILFSEEEEKEVKVKKK